MILNPTRLHTPGLDARSREILEKTVAFFESKGKRRLRQDDLDRVWYQDFLDFVRREQVFADILAWVDGAPLPSGLDHPCGPPAPVPALS